MHGLGHIRAGRDNSGCAVKGLSGLNYSAGLVRVASLSGRHLCTTGYSDCDFRFWIL